MAAPHQTTEKVHAPDGSLTISEMERRAEAWRDSVPTTTRCAFCPWTFEGPAGEGRTAAGEHRAAEHPEARRLTKRERDTAAAKAANEQAEKLKERKNGRAPLDAMDAMDAKSGPAPSYGGVSEGGASSASAEGPRAGRGGRVSPPSASAPAATAAPSSAEDETLASQNGGTSNVDERAEIIAEIQRRAVDGRPPSSKKPDQKLSNRAKGVFGSWNAAIIAAGFEPNAPHAPVRTAPTPPAESDSVPELPPADEDPPAPIPPEVPPEGGDPPPLAELAAELEQAWRASQEADDRLWRARTAFKDHPVFDEIWSIYGWDEADPPKPEICLAILGDAFRKRRA